jgi:hypothetical protein
MLFVILLVSALLMVMIIEWSPLVASILVFGVVLMMAHHDYFSHRNCKLRATLRWRAERASKHELN